MSQIPEFEILFKLDRLIAICTDLVDIWLTIDNTKATHDLNHLKGSILVSTGGQIDKFDTCTKSY